MEKNINKKGQENRPSKERGLAIVTCLIILPLLILLLTFSLCATLQLTMQSELLQLCRTELLETQAQSGVFLERLMALNPIIDLIQKSKRISQLALALPGLGPSAFALIQTTMALTQNSEKGLLILQKYFLSQFWLTLEKGLFHTEAMLAQRFHSLTLSSKYLLHLGTPVILGNHPHTVSVEPEPPMGGFKEKSGGSLGLTMNPAAPTLKKYKMKSNFTQEQKLKIHWIFQFQWKIPALYERDGEPLFLFQTHRAFCSATLEEKKPWYPTLLQDKS